MVKGHAKDISVFGRGSGWQFHVQPVRTQFQSHFPLLPNKATDGTCSLPTVTASDRITASATSSAETWSEPKVPGPIPALKHPSTVSSVEDGSDPSVLESPPRSLDAGYHASRISIHRALHPRASHVLPSRFESGLARVRLKPEEQLIPSPVTPREVAGCSPGHPAGRPRIFRSYIAAA